MSSPAAAVQGSLPLFVPPKAGAPQAPFNITQVHKVALALFLGCAGFSMLFLLTNERTPGHDVQNGHAAAASTLWTGLVTLMAALGKRDLPPTANTVDHIHRGKRDACTSTPAAVPVANELSTSASFTSYDIAGGVNGGYIRAWIGNSDTFYYQVLNETFEGPVFQEALLSTIGNANRQIYVAAYPNGNYLVVSTYASKYQPILANYYCYLHFDTLLLDPRGVRLNKYTSNAINVPEDCTSHSSQVQYKVALAALPSNQIVLSAVIVNEALSPTFNIYNSNGVAVNSYSYYEQVQSSFLASAGFSNGNSAQFWYVNGFLYGIVMDDQTAIQVFKKQIASVNLSALSCSVLLNQNVVVAWVNTASNKAEFQLVDSQLNPIGGVVVVDGCSSGSQSQVKVMSQEDGFVVALTAPGNGLDLFGYRFASDGTLIDGRFSINAFTNGDQTGVVIVPFGSRGLFASWANGTAHLSSRPLVLNTAPVVAEVPQNPSAFIGHPYALNLTGVFFDRDDRYGDTSLYGLSGAPSTLTFDPSTVMLSGTPQLADFGNHTLTFTTEDSFAKSTWVQFPLSILYGAPLINGVIPPQEVSVGQTYDSTVPSSVFFDPNGGRPIHFTASNLPGWATLTAAGLLSGIPYSRDIGTTFVILTGDNVIGGKVSTNFTLTVVDNSPFIVTPPTDQTAFVGQPFRCSIGQIFSNPSKNGTLKISTGWTPPFTWLTKNDTYLVGTPWYADVQTLQVTVMATNGLGLSQNATFLINVEGDNQLVLAIKILGPVFSALGALFSVYRYRQWIKEKALLGVNFLRTRRITTAPKDDVGLNLLGEGGVYTALPPEEVAK